jgi:hypothetical protein
MKWTASAAAATLALAMLPAVGQARVYTGKMPTSIAASHVSARHTVKLASKKKKHKVKKHKKAALKSHHVAHSTKAKA